MGKVHEPFGAALEDGTKGDAADAVLRQLGKGIESQSALATTLDEREPDWLDIAKVSYEDTTEFLDTSLRKQWETNERAFQSRHPFGSKYLAKGHERRSRLYRPKTRSMMRQAEAQLASAYFSNEDIISVKALDPSDADAAAGAEMMKEIVQYRLSTPNKKWAVPWFMTCVGAYQDAQKYGIVVSKQWWEYQERTETESVQAIDPITGMGMTEIDPATGLPGGAPIFQDRQKITVLCDRPHVELFPPENARVDKAAHWLDPINTSPVVILLIPMYIHEVERRMHEADPRTGQPPWITVDRTRLKLAASRHSWDSTRAGRSPSRDDTKESTTAIDDYSIVWVHENFVKWGGRDLVYYTSGIHDLLSNPVDVGEVYAHASWGERPIVMGYGVIETHKIYPSGKPELVQGLQAEANEIVNMRLDNVKLAMNKRFLVRRGRTTDIQALTRASPSSVVLTNDPESDVKEIEVKDVTASAYQEQERINADMDEIGGQMSVGTVQTSRKLNETVGGMKLLAGAANSLGELDLRVFTETWTEPVLRQVVEMIRKYESEPTILALGAKKAKLWQRFGIDAVTDELIDRDLSVKVNVGVGATDPNQKLQRFMVAAKSIGEIFGEQMLPFLNAKEIIKEIFGVLGYRDGDRFFTFETDAPVIDMMQKQIEKLTEELKSNEAENQTRITVAKLGAMSRVMQQSVENKGNIDIERFRAMIEMVTGSREGQRQERISTRGHMTDFAKEIVRSRTALQTAKARASRPAAA